jgi:hypothetical protein
VKGPAGAALTEIEGRHYRYYSPLEEETGLFRTFAELEVNHGDILKFANRYGPLGFAINPARAYYKPEKFDDWKAAILRMNGLVQVWEALRQNDQDAIHRWVQPVHRPAGTPPSFEVNIPGIPAGERDSMFAINYPIADATDCLREVLDREVTWQLHESEVWMTLLWDKETGRDLFVPAPCNLIGALWVQFAQSVADTKHHRKCPNCGRWFELTPRLNRADRLTCSDACRVAYFRARQATAQELRENGKTPTQIAKELDVPLESVKTWLKKKGK